MVRQRPELVEKRPGVGVQVDEDEAFPAFAADRAQIQVSAQCFRAEGFRIGDSLQAPVQIEAPVVEAACEAVRKAALAVIDDAVAPMRTDVEEGTDRSIIAANDDDALDRRSAVGGQSVDVRVDLGGRGINKKTK